jgi:hypothetical protein
MITKIEIGSITIGGGDANYSLKEAQGFGTAYVDTVSFDRPGFHGAKVPRAFYRERVMRLRIGVRSSTKADYAAKRRALLKAFDLPREGLTTMKITTTEPLSLQTSVQLNGAIEAPLLGGEVTAGEMWVSLIAPNPLLLSQTLTTTDITFADGSGVIANTGDAPVFPTIRLYGELLDTADIVIENDTTGRKFSLTDLELTDAEYADIDMEEETVIKNDLQNLYAHIDEDYFWWLQEGNNTILLTGNTGSSGDRKATISYRLGYLGV